MGTKIHCESYLPGLHSMGNLNEDSSSGCWPFFFGDKNMTNGHYYNGFVQQNLMDTGYQSQSHEKDGLKRKMLEHEAVFKNQVSELHRLYRIQRNMMDEVKRKEPQKHRVSMEPASSSIPGTRVPSNGSGKWHMAGFSLLNSGCDRTPVSEVKFANSSISCAKENMTHLGHVPPFLNGSASKDLDMSDSRPLKVRKKLFDLHLPAEEYMDTEEGEKLLEDRQIDALASAPCLSGPIGLADLNDPIQTEEANAASSVEFFIRASENEENKRINEPTKSNAGYFGTAGETAHVRKGFLIPSAAKSKANDRGCLSNADYAGFSRKNLSNVPKGHQPVKSPLPSPPAQSILIPAHHPPGTRPTGYVREDMWKEMPQHSLDSDKNHGHPNNSCLESVAASWTHGSFSFFSSSSLASSRDNCCHPGPVQANPAITFTQNATTLEASSNATAVMNGSLQPPAQSQVLFGGKWQGGASASLNFLCAGESKVNGFYQASTSGPLAGLYDLNNSTVGNLESDHSTNHQLGNILNVSSQADSKPAPLVNLNEDLSKSSLNEVVILQDSTVTGKGKPEDSTTALLWHKPKPTNVNHLCTTKGMWASSDYEVGRKYEISETQTVKKILGFPIFDKGVQESESSSLHCHPVEKNSSKKRENGMIDINVACEPDDQTAANELSFEKETKKGAFVRGYIDLNTCGSDFEDPPASCSDPKCAGVKIALDIDLEAPALPESEDDDTVFENKDEQIHDVVLQTAAKTIVAISSCPENRIDDNICNTSEASLEESVCWFIDAMSSHANEFENISVKEPSFEDGSAQQDSSNEMDDFEAMTLQLEEATGEDYMPQPFVPEVEKEDDTRANMAPNRSRRGMSRRGRQRRDFQRDILPGLATLARHEVTEDIQAFGGVMRASGHSWNPGLTRRNGGSRGRRRAVVETVPTATPIPVYPPLMQQFTSIEAGLEERSLAGWGKTTTRRPRRQRCPASNPHPVAVLT